MEWIKTRVVFQAHDPELAEVLISDVFHDLGQQGVVVETPDLDPVEGWGADALLPGSDYAVVGYIPGNDLFEERKKNLETRLSDLEGMIDGFSFSIQTTPCQDADWAEAWKAFFWPERVGNTLVVKPTWRTYTPSPGDRVIEIDPGMAFGTGTHPTTSLCVGMIEDFVVPGCSVLDVGTGSGILLIAAEKMGAGRLVGVDTDEVAVAVARENLGLNGLRPDQYTVSAGNGVDGVTGTYDIVVANILAHVVDRLLDSLDSVLHTRSRVIFSGITADQADGITNKMARTGYEQVQVAERDGWVGITGIYAA